MKDEDRDLPSRYAMALLCIWPKRELTPYEFDRNATAILFCAESFRSVGVQPEHQTQETAWDRQSSTTHKISREQRGREMRLMGFVLFISRKQEA